MFRLLRSRIRSQRVLLALFLFLSLYSGALYAFATTYVTPGTVLDPSGLPGAYTVGPLLSYGGAVTTGHDNEILYTDGSGNLTSDSLFTRSSAGATNIEMTQGSDYVALQLGSSVAPIFGGLPGIGLYRSDSADTDYSAFMGIVDGTGLGAGPNTIVMNSVDTITGVNSLLFFIPSLIGFSSGDGNEVGGIQAAVGQAAMNVDNLDGGGNDSATMGVVLNGGGGNQGAFMEYSDGTDTLLLTWGSNGLDLDFDDGNHTAGLFYVFPKVDGTSGQVLTTDGAGSLSWDSIPSATATLTDKYIGVGDGSNELTGYTNFQYNQGSYLFSQSMPSNINGGTALGAPLQFGSASFTGSGLDDMTLNWSVSNYQSNKYGGNLTIQIDSTGTPDSFSWSFSGGYSQIIGSASGVAITGSPQLLEDTNGNVIAEITFGSTTGHTNGDRWSAGTSLSIYDWGSAVYDTDGHVSFLNKPVYGVYEFGDTNRGGMPLRGNQTRFQINDNVGELGLYVSRYFRLENPGGNTAILADMANDLWTQYTDMFSIKNTTGTRTWFDVSPVNKEINIGDITAAENHTLFTVNDNSQSFIFSSPNSAGSILSVTNSDGTCTLDPGDVSGLSCPSDENLKKDITTLSSGALAQILELRPVTYRLKNESNDTALSTGLIAQEVQQIFPTLVKIQRDNTLALNYGGLTPFIIKAIQELEVKIENISGLSSNSTSIVDQFVNAVIHVKSIIFGSSETPSGFTMYDTVTHEPYCVTLANGDFVKTSGVCGEQQQQVVPPDSLDSDSSDSNSSDQSQGGDTGGETDTGATTQTQELGSQDNTQTDGNTDNSQGDSGQIGDTIAEVN